MGPFGVRVVVRGRVQGVGFRAFVRNAASRHGVEGEVWNRRQGGVELIAYHDDRVVLDAFVAELRVGPGRVDGLTVEAETSPHDAFGFHIGPTR